jgi:hypothetical protein
MAERILLVTDLRYAAGGRRYGNEDRYLRTRLKTDWPVAFGHPVLAAGLLDDFRVVVVRNSGPVIHYREAYRAFRDKALAKGTFVYNPLTAHGDMAGKQYLVELWAAGEPVIPTVDRLADAHLLPEADQYVVKPKDGADSYGLRVVPRDGLTDEDGILIQPRIDFRYEVSFMFVDDTFQYALYTPDPAQRWALEPYRATPEDLAFAKRFVDWNALPYGIQRVDACRTADGRLLLVELEDHNPFLSLEVLDRATRDGFVDAFKTSLRRSMEVGLV